MIVPPGSLYDLSARCNAKERSVSVIPVAELARRICVAHHPHLNTVGPVPCGAHLAFARNCYGLLTDDLTWNEVVRARSQMRRANIEAEVVETTEITVETTVEIEETTNVEGAPA